MPEELWALVEPLLSLSGRVAPPMTIGRRAEDGLASPNGLIVAVASPGCRAGDR